MTNSVDLGAKIAALTSEIAKIDVEREQAALQVEEGVQHAARKLSDLDAARRDKVAALDQARQAKTAAQQRETAEARDTSRSLEADRQADLRAKADRISNTAVKVDAATVALRSALDEHQKACEAGRPDASDPVLFATYYAEVSPRISTVLSGVAGFAFKRLPFYRTDAKGRPDAEEQALAQRAPAFLLLNRINNAA